MRRTHFTYRSSGSYNPAITVLSGLGGSGKTQISLRFAQEFERTYLDIPVYFLNAESEESLKRDYETLVRALGAEHRSKTHGDALVWLATKIKNWLIILDNADNPKVPLFSYIPKSETGNVIITTRNSNHATLAPNSSHQIGGLSELNSVVLILSSSGYEHIETNRVLATEIVRELGSLPLALAQAAGYIFVNKCLPRYLEIYRKSALDILASSPSQRPDDYKSSVATTIQMSLVRLPQEAQDVLRLFAHFDSASIPHTIIAKAAERQFEHVEWTKRSELDPRTVEQAKALKMIFSNGGEWSEFRFNELIAQCLQYSLLKITIQGEDNFYSMHILVRSYLKATSTLIQNHQPCQLVVRLLGSSFTYNINYKFLAFNRILLPHLRLIQLGDIVEAGDHCGFGQVFYQTGDRRLAILHREKCVEIWRALLGDEDKISLSAMANLALSYNQSERSREALELEELVLASRRKQYGHEHPETLTMMHNIVDSYWNVGRKEEAMAMEEQVLELRKRILGPEDPSTLWTMNNLSASYADLGRTQDALELRELTLEMRRKVLGPEHPDTLKSMYNLAISYNQSGRFEEAMKLDEQVVELRMRVLGSEHPDTLEAMWNLTCSLENLSLKERWLDILRIAVPAHEKVFGVDHSKTIQLTSELKKLLSELSYPVDMVSS